MARNFTRQDFLIEGLAVSIGSVGRGGTWMPGPGQPTPPSPISPFASVGVNLGYIEGVRVKIADAVKAKKFDDIAGAFVPGSTGGSPEIRSAIHEIGSAVVASAAYAELSGGEAGLINPECGGTSYETIPPTLTPVVQVGVRMHRTADLPRLQRQLSETMKFLEKAAAAQAPTGDEVGEVRAKLKGALDSLG